MPKTKAQYIQHKEISRDQNSNYQKPRLTGNHFHDNFAFKKQRDHSFVF